MASRRPDAVSAEAGESYRRVAAFLATAVRERRFDSVLVASATAGEGTTTVAARVADLLRDRFGLRPLLIELNQRRPVYARRFGLDPGVGLAAIAAGERPVKSCVQHTPGGLAVIVAGPVRPGPEAATGAALVLKRILNEVSGDFDLVIVDAPPVLEQADAISAGAVVPHIVLVVEAGRTPYEVIDRARQALAANDIDVVAAVLTKQPRVIPEWIYRWLAR